MKARPSVLAALATAVFAMGAFSRANVAYAGGAACSGKDIACSSGTCQTLCPNPQEPDICYKVCPLQAKAEE